MRKPNWDLVRAALLAGYDIAKSYGCAETSGLCSDALDELGTQCRKEIDLDNEVLSDKLLVELLQTTETMLNDLLKEGSNRDLNIETTVCEDWSHELTLPKGNKHDVLVPNIRLQISKRLL